MANASTATKSITPSQPRQADNVERRPTPMFLDTRLEKLLRRRAGEATLELEPGDIIADWIIKTYVKTAVVSGSVTLLRDLVLRMGGRVSEGLPDKELEGAGGNSMKAEFAERLLGVFGVSLETPTTPPPFLGPDPTSSQAMTNPEQGPAATASPTQVSSDGAQSQSSKATSQPAPTAKPLTLEAHAPTLPSIAPTELSRSESRHCTTAATLPPSTLTTALQTAPGPLPTDAPAATSPLVSPTVLSRSESRHCTAAATLAPSMSTTVPQTAPGPLPSDAPAATSPLVSPTVLSQSESRHYGRSFANWVSRLRIQGPLSLSTREAFVYDEVKVAFRSAKGVLPRSRRRH
jgi:hypothetical protein